MVSESCDQGNYFVEARGVQALNSVELQGYKWKLSYSKSGNWTHPELAFPDILIIPIKDLTVSFTEH